MSKKINTHHSVHARKIVIDRYEGNTHYSVHIIDSFGKEYHLGYSNVLNEAFHKEVERKAQKIWKNEVEPKVDLMSKAIKECIEIDIKNGIEPSLD